MKDKIYLPTPMQAILIPILTLVGLVMTHYSLIQQKYFVTESAAIANVYISAYASYLDHPVINATGLFVFWLLVGAIAYVTVVGIGMVIHAYTSDLTPAQYINPVEGRSDRVERLIRFFLRSGALFLLVAWFIETFWFLLPWADAKFGEMIAYNYWPIGIMAYVILIVNFIAPIFFARLLFLRTRVFQLGEPPF